MMAPLRINGIDGAIQGYGLPASIPACKMPTITNPIVAATSSVVFGRSHRVWSASAGLPCEGA